MARKNTRSIQKQRSSRKLKRANAKAGEAQTSGEPVTIDLSHDGPSPHIEERDSDVDFPDPEVRHGITVQEVADVNESECAASEADETFKTPYTPGPEPEAHVESADAAANVIIAPEATTEMPTDLPSVEETMDVIRSAPAVSPSTLIKSVSSEQAVSNEDNSSSVPASATPSAAPVNELTSVAQAARIHPQPGSPPNPALSATPSEPASPANSPSLVKLPTPITLPSPVQLSSPAEPASPVKLRSPTGPSPTGPSPTGPSPTGPSSTPAKLPSPAKPSTLITLPQPTRPEVLAEPLAPPVATVNSDNAVRTTAAKKTDTDIHSSARQKTYVSRSIPRSDSIVDLYMGQIRPEVRLPNCLAGLAYTEPTRKEESRAIDIGRLGFDEDQKELSRLRVDLGGPFENEAKSTMQPHMMLVHKKRDAYNKQYERDILLERESMMTGPYTVESVAEGSPSKWETLRRFNALNNQWYRRAMRFNSGSRSIFRS